MMYFFIPIVVPRNEEVTFFVGLTSGELSVNGTFDRETVSRYFVTVDVSEYCSARKGRHYRLKLYYRQR